MISFSQFLLFAFIFFKDPQQYNHPLIYKGHVFSVQIKRRYNVYSMSRHLKWLYVTTWLNSHAILHIGNPHYKFDDHTLCESVNVTMKTTINFCMTMIWRSYFTSWSKRSLNRYGLLEDILCEWWWVRHYFEWVWVILGGWGII